MKKYCFTLVEIVMVVALIAVLTGIAIGGYSYAMGSAKESATKSIIKQVETALENAKAKHGFYPSAASDFNSIDHEDDADRRYLVLTYEGNSDPLEISKAWKLLPTTAKVDNTPTKDYQYMTDLLKSLDLESLREYIVEVVEDGKTYGVLGDAWGTPIVYYAPYLKSKSKFKHPTINQKNFLLRSLGPDSLGKDSDADEVADDITN